MDHKTLAADFHRDGFAIVRSVYTPAEVAQMDVNVRDFIANIAPTMEAGDIYYEDSPARPVKSIFRMHKRSQYFAQLMEDRRVGDIVAAIFPGDATECEGTFFFGKPARDGSTTPDHQDNTFQCFEPPLAVTLTIAIDESTPDNGALTCQKGSHKLGLLPHRASGVMGFSRCLIEPVDPQKFPRVQLCMKPGDICMHHINTVHGSSPNTTDRSRRQLGMLWKSVRAQPDPVAAAKYQQDLAALHQAKGAK